MENDVTSIILTDEEGKEVEFDVITKMDIEDKEYVVVVPTLEDKDEAVVLRIDKDSDGNDIFVTIEDDEEFEIVAEAYETLFGDEEEDEEE